MRDIAKDPAGILVTSYEQLRLQRNLLLGVNWGCAILDEGHKIRNPDAEVTLVAKQLPTVATPTCCTRYLSSPPSFDWQVAASCMRTCIW